MNLIKATEINRNLNAETFVFHALFEQSQSDTLNIIDIFKEGLNTINYLELSNNNHDRLLRAQGALFSYIYQNPIIKRILVDAYYKEKNHLPFYIK